MKKKILTFIVGAALCGTTMAQESGFGAKLGLNLANVAGDVENTSMRTSLHLGGFYNYMMSDQFALQFELVYSGQGYKTEAQTVTETQVIGGQVITSTVTTPEGVARLDYINIPILAKYYFSESFSALAGPQIGLNIGSKYVVDGESADIEDVSGLDLALGIGAQYELGSGLGFGARYNLGLTNVYSGEGDASYTNNVIQIYVQYQFGL